MIARFACTSPGFAVNAVMPDLQQKRGSSLAWSASITSARYFGFIAGMWVFARLAVADRFPARRVFLVCAQGASAATVSARATARDPQACSGGAGHHGGEGLTRRFDPDGA